MPSETSHPDRLAAMLSIDVGHEPTWAHEELGAILTHQLNAPLRPDLEPHGVWPDGLPASDPPPHTFAELLFAQKPSLQLLLLTKAFAKTSANSVTCGLPKPVATAIYYAAIAAALVRLNQRITSLDDHALTQGLQWTADQTWIDLELQSLANAAIRH